MTVTALIDHPWPVNESFDPASDAEGVLLAFSSIVRRHGLTPVPFISYEDYSEAISRLSGRVPAGQGLAAWHRFVATLLVTREEEGGEGTCSVPLTENGRRALLAELRHKDWRRPQLIVPSCRMSAWRAPEPEIEVVCELEGGQELRVYRVIAKLEDYDAHPSAVADGDPWLVQGKRLPRPPSLVAVPLGGLTIALARLPRRDTSASSHYFFIPPERWTQELAGKDSWRRGRAFEHQESYLQNGSGPVDYFGRVWVWDTHHNNHWDVQPRDDRDAEYFVDGYFRVGEDGRRSN